MMKKHATKPTKSKLTVLHHLCNLIPGHLISKLAREHGVDQKARTYSPWSHVVTMLFAQLTHAIGLNDVCDNLRHHSGRLKCIREASAPSKNALSHANKKRSAAMAEALFWEQLRHLETLSPRFGIGQRYRGLPRRFKRAIHAVDSSTIALVANCMDWARHRRRKAAAKLHLRLNLRSFLPAFVIVDTAKHSDNKRARELSAGLHAGEIVVFDKAYVDFAHLFDLQQREVFWVSRAKDNLKYRVAKKLQRKAQGKILRDDLITLKTAKSKAAYGQQLRRVEALVEINGKEQVMVFLTNNLQWSAGTIADLYRSRWGIEVFFKQVKQTLQVCDFLGHSANAVRWQIWTALLLYILLRFQAHLSKWNHSFTRLFTMIRAVAWDRLDLRDLLDFYGTAGAGFRSRATPKQLYFEGMGA